uniref:Genome polyprotein n=1 Tax=Xi'an Ifla-like virus TaxID=2789608 RepID=A0A7T1GW08_9VIRU|nr:polyprotein [Xi'an Ifla-like virus]
MSQESNVAPISGLNTEEQVSSVLLESGVKSVDSIMAPSTPAQVVEGTLTSLGSDLTNRWNLLERFDWSVTSSFGENLKTWKIPEDLFESSLLKINLLPYKVYCYGNCGVFLRLQVNANRFHVGQLQFSWYYHGLDDQDFALRDNVYCASQRPNGIFQVGTSQTCELYIPFKSPLTHLTFRKDSMEPFEAKNFALVQLKVLSALSTSEASLKSASVTVMFRLADANFMGLRSIIAEPQMLPMRMVVKAAEAALNEAGKEFNRDFPTNPFNKLSVVPTGSQSWASGVGDVISLNSLRLDPRATTPHPNYRNDEMLVSNITNHWGLIGKVQWRAFQDQQLTSLPVAPVHSKLLRMRSRASFTQGLLSTRILSPTSVVASMYLYWRGPIEFRFDVVVGPFHTGRLIASFIPGPKKSVSVQEMMQSYYSVFDVTDQTSFIFEVPYIANKSWQYVTQGQRNYGDEGIPIGYLYLSSLNQLVVCDGVSRNVDVLIYMRAPKIEFSVPCNCLVGLGRDREFFHPSYMRIKAGYSSIYAGNWHDFALSAKIICRYGPGSDHIVQVEGGKLDEVYVSEPLKNVMFKDAQGKRVADLSFYAVANHKEFGDYRYLIPFDTLEKARAYVMSGIGGSANWDLCLDYVSDSEYNDGSKWMFVPVEVQEKFELIEPQGDEIKEEIKAQPIKTITHPSVSSFNEDFSDLKSLCRRFNVYFESQYEITEKYELGRYFCKLPLRVDGLKMNFSRDRRASALQNRLRNGMIAVLSSGFRFFRGSLRFKIVVDTETDSTLMVTHIPDETNFVECGVLSESNTDYVGAGYACYGQSMQVNRVLEIEVPYYLPYEFGLIGNISPSSGLGRSASLGCLGFSLLTKPRKKIAIDVMVYYAIGDDMRFSSFMGFPEMVLRTEIPDIEHQGLFGLLPDADKISKDVAGEIVGSVEELKTKVNGSVDFITERTNSVLSNIHHRAEDVMTKVLEVLSNLAKSFGDKSSDFLQDCAFELAHLVANPNIKTLGVSLAKILVKLGIITSDFFSALSKWAGEAITWALPQKQQEGEVVHQGLTNEGITLMSTLIGMISSSLNIVVNAPRKGFLSYLACSLGSGLRDMAVTSNQMLVFLKNNLSVINSIWYWLLGQADPSASYIRDLTESMPQLENWAKRGEELTRLVNRDEVKRDPLKQKDVFICAALGSAIVTRMSLSGVIDPRMNYIRSLASKLDKLQDELKSECLSPMVKFEPFVFQLSGPPGIGKSFMSESLGRRLLKKVGHRYYGESTFVRTPGVAYWNGVRNQPILIYDDLGCTATALKEQVGEIFSIKSPQPFNPPIAELENKKLRYNPFIMALCSNVSYFRDPEITDPVAFNRRRDTLIECRLTDSIRRKYGASVTARMIGSQDLENYGHLEFRFSTNPSNESGPYSDWMTYEEMVNILERQFEIYYNAERKNYIKKLTELGDGYPTDDHAISLVDLARMADNDFGDIDWLLETDTREIMRTFAVQEQPALIVEPQGLNVVMDLTKDETSGLLKIDETVEFDMSYEEIPWNSSLMCAHRGIKKAYAFFRKPGQKYGVFYDPMRHADICLEEDPIIGISEAPCSNCLLHDQENVVKLISQYYINFIYVRTNGPIKIQNKIVPLALRNFHVNVQVIDPFLLPEKKFILTDKMKAFWEQVTSTTLKVAMKVWGLLKPCLGWLRKSFKYLIGTLAIAGAAVLATRPFRKGEADDCPTGFADDRVASRADRSSDCGLLSSKDAGARTVANHPLLSKILADKEKIKIFTSEDNSFSKNVFGSRALSNFPVRLWGPSDQKHGDITNRGGDSECFERQEVRMAREDGCDLLAESHPIGGYGVSCNSGAVGSSRRGRKSQSKKLSVGEKLRRVPFPIHEGSYESDLRHLLFRNSGLVEAHSNGVVVNSHRYLALCDRFIVVTKHLLETCSSLSDFLLFRGPSFVLSAKLSDCELIASDGSSIAIIRAPRSFPPFRDIRRHIATIGDHDYVGSEGILYLAHGDHSTELRVSIRIRTDLHIAGNGSIEAQHLQTAYQYGHSERGSCCGALISNVGGVSKIIGLHVAGSSTYRVGFAEPITREQCGGLANVLLAEPEAEGLYVERRARCDINGVAKLGVVDDSYTVRLPYRSRIVPTILHDRIYKHVTEPAPLSRDDPRIAGGSGRSPFQCALDKIGRTPGNVDLGLLDRAIADLTAKVRYECVPILPTHGELLTKKEIFEGIPGLMKSLKLDTSEGYPLVLERPDSSSDKRWLFDYEEKEGVREFKSYHFKLKQLIDQNAEMRAKGIVPFSVFLDTLKDARIPIEKVTVPGKTRMFSCSPVENTLATKKYFGMFQLSYTKNFKAENAIGIDIDSPELTVMLDGMGGRLLEPRWFCGDYSAFGDTIQPEFLRGAFDVIRSWYKHHYGDREDHIRAVIEDEVCNAVHLAGNQMYRSICGLPSGFALTVELNSLVNSLYLRYSFLKENRGTMRDFNRFVSPMFYGDDLLVAIDKRSEFSAADHCKVMTEMGIKFTDADKEKMPSDTTLDKVKFLKRRFVRHPTKSQYWLGELDEASIMDCLNWTWENTDPEGSALEACRACLNNAFCLGPKRYGKIRSRIEFFWAEEQNNDNIRYFHSETWHELDEKKFPA